ncbi:hypothetical protein F991_00043 [Acinetobacter sp. CIP-A165]|nr:hypothetical protein F991_00043 [Acinetobacter sp. CIP-A165]
MLVGVLIHYVSMTSPYDEWRYHSYFHENVYIYHLIYFTHFFRMETFFLLAGFFSLLLCDKRGKNNFLENRKQRVLKPLVFSCLTVSTLSFMLIYYIYREGEVTLNNIIMHFWFLLTLFIISLIFFVSRFYLKIINKDFKVVFFCSFILLMALLFIRFIFVRFFPTDTFVFQAFNYFLFNTLYFGVFFLIGWLLYSRRNSIHVFFTRKTYIISAIVLCVASSAYLNYYALEVEPLNIYQIFFSRSVEVLTSLVASVGLFLVFYDLKIYGNVIRYLVNSSIVVYIFHVPYLIAFGFIFDGYILNDVVYFFCVVSCTYLLSFLTYEVMKRNRFLCSIYGLKYQ